MIRTSFGAGALWHWAQKMPACRIFAVSVILLFAWSVSGHAALAVTPESPEVKKVVAKAIPYLETAIQGHYQNHPGARALVAMCMLKHYGKEGKNHAKVKDAVDYIRECLAKNSMTKEQLIYNVGICQIFLLDLDSDDTLGVQGEYRTEMENLLKLLLAAQKPNGGFGYPYAMTGDTSMTQYAALCMWASQIAGIPVESKHFDELLNWLLRTQDPSGGYGYQGVDPGSFSLVAQQDVKPSLSAAGLASVCICAESLKLFRTEEVDRTGPSQLTRVVKAVEKPATSIEPPRVTETLRRGHGWFSANYTPDYKMSPPMNTAYYMYAFERYKAFLSLVMPKEKDDGKWYDDGFNYLSKEQAPNGSWDIGHSEHAVVDTAFCVLFLMRSTQKIILRAKTFGGGLLVGGRGLPENATDLELQAGSLRAKPLKGPFSELMQKLDPNDPKFEEAARAMEEQSLVEEGDQLTDVQKRLRVLAGGKSPEARATALKLLGRTRNLDNVPLLIEALRDNDGQVFLAASDALRFVSRKFKPAGQFSGDDPQKEAIAYWKAWYRGIRPEARFEDE
ncbi:MAG TPA: hypothetical protein VHC22_11785 [Pirellulales bacterium]|nr:hypothetical protein [Pirellulales bacterium]